VGYELGDGGGDDDNDNNKILSHFTKLQVLPANSKFKTMHIPCINRKLYIVN
jgi:hypothetical protein